MLGHMPVTCLKGGVLPYFSRTPQQASVSGGLRRDQLQPWASSQNCPLHSLNALSLSLSTQLLLVKACQAAGWRLWGWRQRDRANRFGAGTRRGNYLCLSFLPGTSLPSLLLLPSSFQALKFQFDLGVFPSCSSPFLFGPQAQFSALLGLEVRIWP